MIKKILVLILVLLSILIVGCADHNNIKNGLYLLDNVDSVWIIDSTKVDKFKTVPELKLLNIKTAYTNIGWNDKVQNYYIKEKPIMYASFIESANSYGIEVEAFLKNDKESYSDLKKEISSIFDFNEKYKYRFSAIHLDIGLNKLEPKNNNHLDSHLNILKELQKDIRRHNEINNDNIKLIVDIPYWVSEEGYTNFVDDLFNIIDEIVVLNFDTEEDLFKNNIQLLRKAEENNKSMKIGVSLENNSILESKNPDELIEFFEDNLKEFNKYNSFNGLAISEYNSLENYNEKYFKK